MENREEGGVKYEFCEGKKYCHERIVKLDFKRLRK
jgi:hypothetical protein